MAVGGRQGDMAVGGRQGDMAVSGRQGDMTVGGRQGESANTVSEDVHNIRGDLGLTRSPSSDDGSKSPSPPPRQNGTVPSVMVKGKVYEKPTLSFISLISQAIFSIDQGKMLLGDIYQYVIDNYTYYKHSPEKAWRNSIRHNLTINECFIKAGRADNGKGNFWAVHPACVEDFKKGDFRRRQAHRRARRSQQVNVSSLPMSYRCNMEYVPMASSHTDVGVTSFKPECPAYSPPNYAPPTTQYAPYYTTTPPPASQQSVSPSTTTTFPTTYFTNFMTSPVSLTSSACMTTVFDQSHCMIQSNPISPYIFRELPALRDALSSLSNLSY